MNHSKASEPVRSIKVKNNSDLNFTTREIITAIDNYLFSHQLTGSIPTNTHELNDIISSFA